MAVNVANTQLATDTFYDWIVKTNEAAYVLSTQAVTANDNVNGGYTSGNAYVNGTFSANTLAVIDGIRGGNVATSNILNIITGFTSNTSTYVAGITHFSSNTQNQVADSNALTSVRSIKYLLQVNAASQFQSTEVMVLTDGGANVYMTEYATLTSNGILATFHANVASGNVNLLFTPKSDLAVGDILFQRISIRP